MGGTERKGGDMNTYVINLDRRADKWVYMRTELDRVGLRVIRMSAIDTKPGWVGCRLSHLMALSKCDIEPTMILEDDVKFLCNLSLIDMAKKQLPSDWDVLYLGASPKQPQERYSTNLFRLKNAHCLHAYVINNNNGCVDYILDNYDNIKKIDDFFATAVQDEFNCFITYPMLATQIQFQSDTCKRSDVSTILKNYTKFVHD